MGSFLCFFREFSRLEGLAARKDEQHLGLGMDQAYMDNK